MKTAHVVGLLVALFVGKGPIFGGSVLKQLDSLKTVFAERQALGLAPTKENLELTKKLAECHLRLQRPETDHFIDHYQVLAQRAGDRAAEAYASLLRADLFLQQNQYVEALESARKSQRLFILLNRPLLTTRAMIQMGEAVEHLYPDDQHYQLYFRALKFAEKHCDQQDINKDCGVVLCMANMFVGNIYYEQKLIDKALTHIEQGRLAIEAVYQKYPHDHEVAFEYATLLANQATLDQRKGADSSRLINYEQSLNLFRQLGVLESEVIVLSHMANTYLHMGNIPKARKLALESIQAAQQGKDSKLPMYGEILLARINLTDKNLVETRAYLQQAKDRALANRDIRRLAQIAQLSAQVDSLDGRFDSAIRSLNQYVALKDSLNSQEKRKLIRNLEAGYQLEKRNKEQALAEKEYAEARTSQLLKTGFVVLLLTILSLGGVTLYFRNRSLIRQRELARQQQRVAQLEQEKLNMELEQKKMQLEFKNKELTTLAGRLMDRNNFIEQLHLYLDQESGNGQPPEIIKNLKKQLSVHQQSNLDVEEFRMYVNEVNRNFYYNLSQHYPMLTEKDKRLCAMLRMNLSIKEIATINRVSENAIRTAKHRLRKKLGLQSDADIQQHLSTF